MIFPVKILSVLLSLSILSCVLERTLQGTSIPASVESIDTVIYYNVTLNRFSKGLRINWRLEDRTPVSQTLYYLKSIQVGDKDTFLIIK